MKAEPEAPIHSKAFWAVLLLIVGLGIGLRCVRLNDRSITADEAYELRHLSTSVLEVARDADDFPPLYRWCLSLWMEAFGQNSARVLSIVFGSMAIAVVGVLARGVGGDRVGWAAGFFSAISAHQIDFSQQCRSYSFTILAAALAVWAGWRLREKQDWLSWAYLIVACFVVLGTHYFAALLIVQIWGLLWMEKSWTGRLHWLIAALIYVVICIPWIGCLLIDLANPVAPEMINAFDVTSYAYTYLTTVQGWTVGVSPLELTEISKMEGIVRIGPWATVSLGSSAVLAWSCIRKLGLKRSYWFLVFLLVTPLFAGIAAVAVQTSYVSRYVAWMAVPYAVLVAGGMEWRRASVACVVTYLLIAVNLLSSYNRWFVERFDRDNYAQVAEFLSSQPKPRAVLAVSHYLGHALHRALPKDEVFQSLALGAHEPMDWPERLAALNSQIDEDATVYVVTEWEPKNDTLNRVRNEFWEKVGAKKVARISNNLDVFEVSAKSLRN